MFGVGCFHHRIQGTNIFQDRRILLPLVFEVKNPIDGRISFESRGLGRHAEARGWIDPRDLMHDPVGGVLCRNFLLPGFQKRFGIGAAQSERKRYGGIEKMFLSGIRWLAEHRCGQPIRGSLHLGSRGHHGILRRIGRDRKILGRPCCADG